MLNFVQSFLYNRDFDFSASNSNSICGIVEGLEITLSIYSPKIDLELERYIQGGRGEREGNGKNRESAHH